MFKSLFLLILLCASQLYPTSKDVIRDRIERVVAKLPKTTRAAILIYNPLTQDTVYKNNHTVSMIPASNTKLFTTATALNLMEGDFSIATKLLTEDFNIKDGEINGNLYIKGYGNSMFTEADLASMVLELKNAGVTKVTGNIIGDDTYFDDIYTRDDWITDEVANVKLPPISAIVIDRNRTVTYRKRGKRMRSYVSNISNPPLHAAQILKEKLTANGIEVLLSPAKGIAPDNIYTISEKRIILRELIKQINKRSDNFLAECLFKTIGAAASGQQGNAFYSTQAILDFIDDNGIYAYGTSVVDGSGISRFNQITVGAIAGLLEKMYFDLRNFEDYYESFSIAGVDGTLRNRMIGTSAENNFHGKTGTLNGVTSLSGYVTTKSNEDLVVSMIFEFKRGGSGFHK
ncbi:MAG: D-alanyl-D-alanine carboxypeptidase/D-alanyl-D-alanine-endopeptidase, partial [Ignavibacteriaceae bacterium]